MMRPLAWIGLVVLVLGILSFAVMVPMNKTHELKAGDASVGITTHHSEKLPPVVGGVMVAAGVLLLVVGARKATA
jgi:hypothetical protein